MMLIVSCVLFIVFFFKQKTAYEMRISDWSSDVCSSDLFKVVDEHGRMLSGGRNLDQLKAEHGRQAQASFQKLAVRDENVAQALAHEQLVAWTFGPDRKSVV